VLQTGKLHFAYILDRKYGRADLGVQEKAVKRSGVAGDENSPTQPFPVKPPPTARLSMTRADINKMTPEIEKFYCTEFWDANNMVASGPFDRAARDQAMVTFGAPVGGWGPLSFKPADGVRLFECHECRQLPRGWRPSGRWLWPGQCPRP
jgi:quinoprotein glucose dehydrogenase